MQGCSVQGSQGSGTGQGFADAGSRSWRSGYKGLVQSHAFYAQHSLGSPQAQLEDTGLARARKGHWLAIRDSWAVWQGRHLVPNQATGPDVLCMDCACGPSGSGLPGIWNKASVQVIGSVSTGIRGMSNFKA